jgi:DNA-binding NtrC family response regulator
VVIDSEPTVRTVVKSILERAGYSVRATEDFSTATQMIREVMPDLVMTNVFLQGISGHDAMQVLRKDFPDIPILMISGLPDDSIIQRWTGEAHFDMFPKPFTQNALVQKVSQMLEESRTSRPPNEV